jgi:hypothetical protein
MSVIEDEMDFELDSEQSGKDEKEKRRLTARRQLEDRLEEKRLRAEIADDFYAD